jgi:taurine dioxygenase
LRQYRDVTTTETTAEVDLDIRPLSANIGAEIHGLDLKEAFDPAVLAAVRAAWVKHKVVFFPGQHLTPAQHIAFARQFGELTAAHPVLPGIAGHPEVFEIDYGALIRVAKARGAHPNSLVKRAGLDWHTDITFVPSPPTGSILNAVVMPESGGDTMWSNQVAAYAALSPTLQAFLETLTAVHDGTSSFAAFLKEGRSVEWDGVQYTSLDPVEHPVVRRHPESGEKSLFVNAGFTQRIKQLAPDESAALLSFLYAHSTSAEFTVRYHWRSGDIGMWDNRATQHSVVGDYGDQDRVIQRVTLKGEPPVSVLTTA